MSILLLAPALLVARQAADPQSGTEAVQGMPAALPGTPVPPPEAPPDVLWTVTIAAAPATSPIIAGEHVIISHQPGVIAAHRVTNGGQIWKTDLVPEQPLVADATMVFVASGEAIHALRLSDCAIAWRAPSGTLTAPLLVQGGWVIAANATKLIALRAADGTAVWTVDAPAQRDAAAISGETLFVPSGDGFIRARDLKTGNQIWEHRLKGQPGEPLGVGDSLIVGGSDKALYKLSAATGDGMAALATRLAGELGRTEWHGATLTRARHRSLVGECAAALRRAAETAGAGASEEYVLADLKDALTALEELRGVESPEDMLQSIFATFCIGK
jgi:hypothetical protein